LLRKLRRAGAHPVQTLLAGRQISSMPSRRALHQLRKARDRGQRVAGTICKPTSTRRAE
jgi:hypothetical protein